MSFGFIDLPNPILGDGENLDIHTVFGVSMDKSVYSIKHTPSHSDLSLSFEGLTQQQVTDFRTWYLGSRGKQITYTDYEAVDWEGFIVNEPMEQTTIGPKICPTNKEVYSMTVQFKARD